MMDERELNSGDRNKEENRQQFNYVAPDDDAYGNIYRLTPFVDGVSEYDSYQQAWRFLGFMVDCNAKTSSNNNNEGHGSRDAQTTGEGCKRYLLWAAVSKIAYWYVVVYWIAYLPTLLLLLLLHWFIISTST